MKLGAVFRTDSNAVDYLPLTVRSVGHAYRRDSFHSRRQIQWVTIHWCLAGAAVYKINDRSIELEKGQIIVHGPDDWVDMNIEGEYHNRWFTFDGDIAVAIVKSYQIPFLTSFAIDDCPVSMFTRLEMAMEDNTPTGKVASSGIVFELLTYIRRHMFTVNNSNSVADNNLLQKAILLIDREWNDPDFDVNRLASLMAIHRVHLHRLFRRERQTTPSAYINHIRLSRALKMIHESTLPIKEIALKTGFSDAAYFTKKITQASGMSPGKIRAVH